MSWLLTNLAATFLLPPLNGLLPALCGLVLWRRRPRLAWGLVVFGVLFLTAQSLPLVARGLLLPLEGSYPALAEESLAGLQVDGIVVLGAGRYLHAPEFGGRDEVGEAALARLRYAALLARISGKPLLTTGGTPGAAGRPAGAVMQEALVQDFGLAPRWVEQDAENTWENARRSAAILLPQGVRRIALVTHAYHMPRAVAAFEAAGFQVVPAPTAFLTSRREVILLDWLPRYEAMRGSALAIHEAVGLLWYRWRRE